ncbi:MAG: hypothetical protein QOE92_419, partial [Chloroflexota bacterium]|nr:hypothetical protein [Chloroflexota bacterium]
WFIGGGCGCLLLLVIIVAVLAIVVGGFLKNGGANVAKDFPIYQGARETGFHTFVGTGGTTNDATWEVNTPVSQVKSFYLTELNKGDWKVLSTDPDTGDIYFNRRSNPAEQGQLRLLAVGSTTTIQVQLHKP